MLAVYRSPALARLRLRSGTLSLKGERGSEIAAAPVIPISKQLRRAPSPVFFAAPDRSSCTSFPGKCRGDGAPRGASILIHALRSVGTPDERVRAPLALHRGSRLVAHRQRSSAPGPRFLGRGLPGGCPVRPVPAQRAPRSAVVMPHGRGRPGAARERGYEPRPQAPAPGRSRLPGKRPRKGLPPDLRRLGLPSLHHRNVSRRRPQPEQGEGGVARDWGNIMIIILSFRPLIY